jgi:pSer/pThr/pTyr-binding forkhead associated (FHA) protein
MADVKFSKTCQVLLYGLDRGVMSKKILQFIFVAVLVAGLFSLPTSAAAQGAATFFVTNVDVSRFPEVRFELRAVGLDNQAVSNLNTANLSIYENGQIVSNAQIAARNEGPINVIFVIDQGQYTYYQYFGLNNIRQAITTWVSGKYFVDNRDSVSVLGRQNFNSDQTVTLLPATRKGTDLTTWAANFNFQPSNGPTKGLVSVDDAIKAMSQQVTTPGSQTAAIIFVTRFVEDPSVQVATTAAQNTAATAKQKFISVYAFQTDFGQAFKQPLEALATGATGVYVPLNANTIATNVNPIYQSLAAQRAVYTVSYRSKASASGKRQITINSAQLPTSGLAGSYEVNLQPPKVTIAKPLADSTIRREAKPNADGTKFTYDVNRVKVTADITWLANPRAIKSAQLFAKGELQSTVQPPAGATSVEFDWDISDVAQEGINSVKLEVRVTDELGVETSGSSTVKVEVLLPPKPAENQLTAFLSKYWVVLTIGGIGVLLVGIILIVVLALVMAKPKQSQEQVALAQHYGGASAPQDTLIGSSPVNKITSIGAIQIIEGPKGLVGENINLYKPTTTLGRGAQSADIVFYPNEPSSVSRLHCTIQFDGRLYKLIDENSTSGTWLNGKRLQPNTVVELRDEDEVILGDVTKLGVRFRFYVSSDKAESKSQKDAGRTMIIDDDWGKEGEEKFRE